MEITSSVVTILASNAGFRYVTPVTSVPSCTRSVRAASAPSSVYASRIGSSGPPSAGSCQKWSITHTDSNPPCSAASASATVWSNISASVSPACRKPGIWNPKVVMRSTLSPEFGPGLR